MRTSLSRCRYLNAVQNTKPLTMQYKFGDESDVNLTGMSNLDIT